MKHEICYFFRFCLNRKWIDEFYKYYISASEQQVYKSNSIVSNKRKWDVWFTGMKNSVTQHLVEK